MILSLRSREQKGQNLAHMKTTILPLKHSINRPLALLLIPFALGCFALSPQARATCMEGCSGDNTFLGDDAFLNGTGADNTAIGRDALSVNTSNYNTATGAFALSANTTGGLNTATGFAALASNTTGFRNTAAGLQALEFNTT